MEHQAIPVSYPDAAVPVVVSGTSPSLPAPFHCHTEPDWEICCVTAGEARLRVAERQYDLLAGEILVISPGEPHMLESISGQRWVLMFREAFLEELPGEIRCDPGMGLQVEGVRLPRKFLVPDVQRTALDRVLRDLSEECVRRDAMKPSMCAALLAEFFLILARAFSSTQRPEHFRVPAAARQVVADLCAEVEDELGEPWTLDELARRSGYGVTQLTSLLRAVKGATPWRWLSEQRVRRSKELLSGSDRGMMEIALEVGFGSRSQFHRVFRESTGMTPGRYREIFQQP